MMDNVLYRVIRSILRGCYIVLWGLTVLTIPFTTWILGAGAAYFAFMKLIFLNYPTQHSFGWMAIGCFVTGLLLNLFAYLGMPKDF